MLPKTGSAGGPSGLAKARLLDPTLCSFSAAGHFNQDTLKGGNVVWFDSSMIAPALAPGTPATIYVTKSTLTWDAQGVPYSVSVPDAQINLSPYALQGSASYNDSTRAWVVNVPTGYPGYFFATGAIFQNISRLKDVHDATWTAVISTDTPGLSLLWRWAAAPYTNLGTDYNQLGVKSMDDATATAYANADLAGSPEAFKAMLAHGDGNVTGSKPTDRFTGKFTKPYTIAPCSLGSAGAGPPPTPRPTPLPPGVTPSPVPSPTPTPIGATPSPSPVPVIQPAHAAYITNNNDDTMSIINTQTHTVNQTVSIGSYPYGVALNPATTFVYVGDQGNDQVSMFNTATGLVTGTFTLTLPPQGLSFNPAGTRVYVAMSDNFSGSTAVVDTSTNTVIGSLLPPGSSQPFYPLVSHDGTKIYIGNTGTNLGQSALSIYDASSYASTASVNLTGGDANGMALSPDGQSLYVCNGGGLSFVNLATPAEAAFVPLAGGCAAVTVNTAGTVAYASNNTGGTVSVINVATRSVSTKIPVGLAPEGISLNPTGTEVYVANANSGTVSVISTSSNTVTNTIAVGSGPYAFGNFVK